MVRQTRQSWQGRAGQGWSGLVRPGQKRASAGCLTALDVVAAQHRARSQRRQQVDKLQLLLLAHSLKGAHEANLRRGMVGGWVSGVRWGWGGVRWGWGGVGWGGVGWGGVGWGGVGWGGVGWGGVGWGGVGWGGVGWGGVGWGGVGWGGVGWGGVGWGGVGWGGVGGCGCGCGCVWGGGGGGRGGGGWWV